MIIQAFTKKGSERDTNKDFFWYKYTNDGGVAALADGCSSCTNSVIGAEAVVKSVCNRILKMDWDNEEKVKAVIINEIRQALLKLVIDNKLEYDSLGSTLMVVAVRENSFLTIHIGDGMIVRNNGKVNTIHSYPQNGMTKQFTFLTTGNIISSMRVKIGKIEYGEKICFFTDGYQELLQNQSKVKKEFLKEYFMVKNDIEKIMQNKNVDDATIVMMDIQEE